MANLKNQWVTSIPLLSRRSHGEEIEKARRALVAEETFELDADHGKYNTPAQLQNHHLHTTPKANKHAMLTEILGFVPQLLLDDIADAATDTVNNAIEGLEDYLHKWLASREDQSSNEDLEAEIENGLLEFHTLLCGHRDMSIDMLETWSMRNVFYVPPELKIVMPHHRGLDLTTAPGSDARAQVELDVLRRKIEMARKFQEQLKRADEITRQRLARAEARLDALKFLRNIDPADVHSIPADTRSLFTTIRSLSTAVPPLPTAPAEGSRSHTESRPEFLEWAIKRLVDPRSGVVPQTGDPGAALGNEDDEGDDERRLVSVSSEPSSGSQIRQPRLDLSIIQEADDQEVEETEPLPSSSQVQSSPQPPSSSQLAPQNLSQTSSILSNTSSVTITTVKRRRSSMIGPGMGVGGKRRRSSLGLAERARAGNAGAKGPSTSETRGDGTSGGASEE